MINTLRRIYQEETLAQRSQRMIPAAVYALLVATLYALTFSLVNTYTFSKLPLGFDWLQFLKMWTGMAVIFALFAALATWFTEEYEGIVGGGAIATLLIVLVLMLRGARSGSPAQAFVMALPLLGITMLGAWIARWAAHRHLAILQQKEATRRKSMTRHLGIIFLIGLIPGILGRMDSPSEYAVRQLHEYLQAAPSDPSVLPRLPLKKLPSLQEHLGVDYKMYPRQSTTSVGALEVTVRFTDGYSMTCIMPTGSGNSFITDCNEGTKIRIP